MDSWSIGASFRLVALFQAKTLESSRKFRKALERILRGPGQPQGSFRALRARQVMAAAGFSLALLSADWEEVGAVEGLLPWGSALALGGAKHLEPADVSARLCELDGGRGADLNTHTHKIWIGLGTQSFLC